MSINELHSWLEKPYYQIINRYKQNKGHHALLINSQEYDNGETNLVYAISCWLMCNSTNEIYFCKKCRNCQLMKTGNHPNFYKLQAKEKNSLKIEDIRAIINNIYNHVYQNDIKIIYLSKIDNISKQISNALLKTIEEPPKNVYFIFTCKERYHIAPTFFSRCLFWPLTSPSEGIGLPWLQKKFNKKTMQSLTTALRLCQGAPLAAQNLIKSKYWKIRLLLCKLIIKSITDQNFLSLLPILNCNSNIPLYLLLSLINDILKYKYAGEEFLTNIDQICLINFISKRYSKIELYNQLNDWFICYYKWCNIDQVNKELLITYYLISWEKKFFIK